MGDFEREYEELRALTERELEKRFSDDVPQKTLLEAMRYSLLAGGKRVRPVMLLAFCRACGGEAEKALPFACGLEMLHTYSLIHDDLPCMDDDTLRRGKPTNHVVFGEWTAVLAGDALLTAAFGELLSAPLPAAALVSAGRELAEAAGEKGMCGGQFLDMDGEGKKLPASAVEAIHVRKTAALIRAAARMGVIAGGGTEAQLRAAGDYAAAVGFAFQLRDDLLDLTSTPEVLGKSVGADEKNDKSTFVSVYGAEACERLIAGETAKAKAAVGAAFTDAEFLSELADRLAGREK